MHKQYWEIGINNFEITILSSFIYLKQMHIFLRSNNIHQKI